MRLYEHLVVIRVPESDDEDHELPVELETPEDQQDDLQLPIGFHTVPIEVGDSDSDDEFEEELSSVEVARAADRTVPQRGSKRKSTAARGDTAKATPRKTKKVVAPPAETRTPEEVQRSMTERSLSGAVVPSSTFSFSGASTTDLPSDSAGTRVSADMLQKKIESTGESS
ncbi:unnamed protein product [Oikopleura dioica]|uniref:Uncharacterized protein n=1 Tax=Oikopleura dioica TaxID=34765 RepID=E4YBX4_OIKDI|nr:unnamed protein product [Oikopleura dioica]